LRRSETVVGISFEIRNPHAALFSHYWYSRSSTDSCHFVLVRMHPLFADTRLSKRNAMSVSTAGCSHQFRLEPLPASHYPLVYRRSLLGGVACYRQPWIDWLFPRFINPLRSLRNVLMGNLAFLSADCADPTSGQPYFPSRVCRAWNRCSVLHLG
jgi:hypothetical protein